MKKPRLAYVRFTSCSGCQLTLLNCEDQLGDLAEMIELVDFNMASSLRDDGGELDVVLIEGSVSRPEELERLLELRRRAATLVAVGACALTGGVNALGGADRASLCNLVYGETAPEKKTFPPQPLSRFVTVDLEIAGCPPERKEHLKALGSLLRGGRPALPEYSVCLECRMRENLCLLLERSQPCLGPVSRAGCNACCPSFGVICEGCRGMIKEANRAEQFGLLLDLGLSEKDIEARMRRFTGSDNENG